MTPPADALLDLARASLQMGDANAADTALAPLSETMLNIDQETMALYLRSWVAATRGDHIRERELLADALPLAEAVGGVVLSRTLVGVAYAQADAGQFNEARASAERSLAISIADGDQFERGRALSAVASVTRMAGDYEESKRYMHEVLALAQETGDLELQHGARGLLGVVYHLIGDTTGSVDAYHAAEECYLDELRTGAELGFRQIGVAHANLAQLYLRLGRPAESGPHLETALRVSLEFGRTADMGLCLVIEADRQLLTGSVDEALMLIGALRDDPRAAENDFQEIEQFLTRAQLDPDVVEVNMRRGSGRDIVELCRQILRTVSEDD